jgi:hypothetical protein
MRINPRTLWWAAWSWTILIANGHASAAWGLESVGVRTGFSATRLDEHFMQLDAFSRVDTPWSSKPSQKYRVRTTLDFSAGALGREGYVGFVGSVGPVFTFSKKKFPVELDCGISPTILSRWEFGFVDLDIPFQLTTHGGFNFRLSRDCVANYRFQHMSNAGLGPNNPGLDLHSLSIAYSF